MNYLNLMICSLVFACPVLLVFSNADGLLILTFFIVSFCVACLTWHSSKGDNIINASVYVFFALFFVFGPVIQLYSDSHILVNTMYLDSAQGVLANLCVLSFLCVYHAAYLYFDRTVKSVAIINDKVGLIGLYLLFFVSVAISAYAAMDLLNPQDLLATDIDPMQNALKTKFLYSIPFVTFVYFLQSTMPGRRKLSMLLIIFVLVLLTKNHFLERRNGIGPVYLSIFVLIFPWFLKKANRFILFLYAIMFIAFPVSSVLTHNKDGNIGYENAISSALSHFNQLHYDAWANLVAVLELVKLEGVKFGGQLSGSAFFFVPRAFWQDKPFPTGFLIGDYLTDKYQMWFNNLSAPIIAEGYIDFGFVGVLIYAVVTAYFVVKLKKLSDSGSISHRIVYIYSAFFIFFILRGALLPAAVYYSGALLAIYLVRYLSFKVSRYSKLRFDA